jgi:CMP-N,N'-diacetyllegionaminic acid synthase
VQVAVAAGIDTVILSTDSVYGLCGWSSPIPSQLRVIPRPSALASDDTPMLDVVRDVLGAVPGDRDDIILLLQPTQPLRTPEQLTEAIRLLESTHADSVVSVVRLPLTHSPDQTCVLSPDGRIVGQWPDGYKGRQWNRPAYIRDGTVYAFRRATVEDFGTLYGAHMRPLIIDPQDTCPLDTIEDWTEAERRLTR